MTSGLMEFEVVITPLLGALGYSLVQIKPYQYHGVSVVQVMIERCDDQPVTYQDCMAVSRTLLDLLEVEDPIGGDYNLEVSSPGLERPLVKPQDYLRFKGRRAEVTLRIKLEDHRRIEGTLQGLEDDVVLLQAEAPPKGAAEKNPSHGGDAVVLRIPLSNIKSAHLIMVSDLTTLVAQEELDATTTDELKAKELHQ